MTNEDAQRHRFTAKIADAEPFAFMIELSEEPIYRRAAYMVNTQWKKYMESQPGKSSHYALAKTALAFAELYYRKSEQLNAQTALLDDFEKELDKILLAMD